MQVLIRHMLIRLWVKIKLAKVLSKKVYRIFEGCLKFKEYLQQSPTGPLSWDWRHFF